FTSTLAFGSATSLVQKQVQSPRQAPGQAPLTRPSHSSAPSSTPSPQVSTSQASPTPSPSVSTWPAFGSRGQLSRWSGTPSASVSGLAGTMATGWQVDPGGQSASVTHTPCSLPPAVSTHAPNEM